ncbi:MAG: hypothetical protein AAFX90_19535 [Pseudomonadota bacterium]
MAKTEQLLNPAFYVKIMLLIVFFTSISMGFYSAYVFYVVGYISDAFVVSIEDIYSVYLFFHFFTSFAILVCLFFAIRKSSYVNLRLISINRKYLLLTICILASCLHFLFSIALIQFLYSKVILSIGFHDLYFILQIPLFLFFSFLINWERLCFGSGEGIEHASGSPNSQVLPQPVSYRDKFFMKSERNAALVEDLKNRADSLYSFGSAIIFIILIVLVFGALIVIFAGRITAWGIEEFNPYSSVKGEYDQIQQSLSTLNSNILRLRTSLNETVFQYNINKDNCIGFSYKDTRLPHNVISDYIEEYNEYTKTLQKPLSIEKWSYEKSVSIASAYCTDLDRLDKLEAENTVLSDRLKSLSSNMSKYHDSILTEFGKRKAVLDEQRVEGTTNVGTSLNVPEQNNYQILLTSTVTRFGVLAIIIYLVQILIGLYRYNAMVAAHYRSSADLLVLSDNLEHSRMKNLQSILKPDIQYGKAPTSIPEKVAEGVATVANGARRKKRKQKAVNESDD